MSLVLPPTTTCDIYRSGNAPPASPDVTAVPCILEPKFPQGLDSGEVQGYEHKFSHILLVDQTVDVRDNYAFGIFGTDHDTVYVPDQNGTAFKVLFVERWQRGQPADHKRIYIARKMPTWPTNQL